MPLAGENVEVLGHGYLAEERQFLGPMDKMSDDIISKISQHSYDIGFMFHAIRESANVMETLTSYALLNQKHVGCFLGGFGGGLVIG